MSRLEKLELWQVASRLAAVERELEIANEQEWTYDRRGVLRINKRWRNRARSLGHTLRLLKQELKRRGYAGVWRENELRL